MSSYFNNIAVVWGERKKGSKQLYMFFFTLENYFFLPLLKSNKCSENEKKNTHFFPNRKTSGSAVIIAIN